MSEQKNIAILHIEDDLTDALLMRELIQEPAMVCKYDISHVDCLRDGLALMQTEAYDVVLLDMNLRDVSGFDNITAIRDENPDIPIVVLSGTDNDSYALEAIDYGAQEYLIKGHCTGRSVRHAIRSSIKRKAVERRYYHQANYDDMTKLTNRRFFKDYLDMTLVKARRWQRTETLMFIDLDKFKCINDTFGHDAGNYTLKIVSKRMKNLLRQEDVVARYGGDEFLIVLGNRTGDSYAGAGLVAHKLIEKISAPFEYNGNMINVSASIGIACYPDHAENSEDLIKAADQAMYKAKGTSNRYMYYDQIPEASDMEGQAKAL